MKKTSLTLILASMTLFAISCEGPKKPEPPPPPPKQDPDGGELTKGKTIDLEVLNGTITHLWVAWFVGDQDANQKGQPYHCITVAMKDKDGKNKDETFKGVPLEKFKLLHIGMTLPLIEEFKEDDYGKIEGKIVDYWASPEENKFMLVIRTDSGFRICKASAGLYYNKIKKIPGDN